MKNTGVVRKIDDLGRIVVPKEIRNILNISSGDELEIFVDNNCIILQKYSQILSDKQKYLKLLDIVKDIADGILFITDKEKIINGLYENKNIPIQIKNIINERKRYFSDYEEKMIFDELEIMGYYFICPIIRYSTTYGSIVLVKNSKIKKEDEIFMNVLQNIIENY